MAPPEGRGSIKFALDVLGEIEATIHPSLHVYRWWRPDMALPALWNWLTPGDVERPDDCRVRDLMRVTVSIGVDPTAVPGEGDMLELEAYAELALAAIDPVIYSRNPLGQREARRRGFQTVADRLGDASILALEIPLEVYLDRPITPVP
jgi:hypothetical protein